MSVTFKREISNSDDVLDSRDIDARIEDLELELDPENPESTEEEDRIELALLKALREDVNSSEWRHGLTLIRDTYFEDYARELAEDLYGEKIRNAHWPFDHIDWEAATEALKMDYSTTDFDGVEYWYRS